jgi:hypothetical protein
MSWSFNIKNGDLNQSGPGGFAVVTGGQKLLQDLKHWLLEPQGTDPLHPTYGSSLDGGQRKDGTVIEGLIGSTVYKERLLDAESEIRRVLFSYQQQQRARFQREISELGGKTTFAPNEILYSVDSVDVHQVDDKLVTQVNIRTQNNTNISLIQPVE